MPINSESCPLCKVHSNTIKKEDEDEEDNKTSWIQCSKCKVWYHVHCLDLPTDEIDQIVIYHCPECVPKYGESTYKRKSKRARVSIDYQSLNEGDTFAIDKSSHFHLHNFLNFKAETNINVIDKLTKTYALNTQMEKPILIPQADLSKNGMQLPIEKNEITIDYITDCCGEDTPLEVMDVISQQGISPPWKLKQWREYFKTNEEKRDRIRNVISLEISDVAKLGVDFTRPKCVRDMDVVDRVWIEEDEQKRSKVTKYCLMSVKNSFTDFHIDFGGTSVYYTVLSGAKTFLFFPPTDNNLELYKSWCLEPSQNFIWYPEYTITKNKKKIKPTGGFKVDLQPGDLFIIPSGWIHAVHTPQDSIVIGGNYLTIRDMVMQLKINEIERETKVPTKFRFPMFNKVLWLTAWYYYNHQNEFQSDISEDEDGNAILTRLIGHLQGHLELSKTNATAKRSIPKAIGKPMVFINKLLAWKEDLYGTAV